MEGYINYDGVFYKSIGASELVVGGMELEDRLFEKVESISSEGIESVFIKADCCSYVFNTSKTNSFNIRLHGKTMSNKDPDYTIIVKNNSINITVSDNRIKRSGFMGEIILEISIPNELKLLDATTQNGYIIVKDGVTAENITLSSSNGKIECYGIFKQIFALTQNGPIKVFISAKCDLQVVLNSKNGDVEFQLRNVYTYDVRFFIKHGSVKNYFFPTRGGYEVTGRVSAKNGNIIVG